MTTAHEIMSTARNSNDAIEQAEILAIETNQDWENEATIFEFEDKSVLVVSGASVSAFETKADADESFSQK